MEEAMHDVPLCREFAKLDGVCARLPDETTVLRFRRLLERQNLAVETLRLVNDLLQRKVLPLRTGTAVDATLISAPSSTKNADGGRNPVMKQTRKVNNCHFGMNADIGVDAASGLVYTVIGTPANVNDLNVAGALLHGREHAAFGDAGYQGVHKRPEAAGPTWHVAMRPGLRHKLNVFIEPDFVAERIENMKASIRAKVEHSLRVIEAAVRVLKGAVPVAAKEHRAARLAVCAVEPVDGAAQVDGDAGMWLLKSAYRAPTATQFWSIEALCRWLRS